MIDALPVLRSVRSNVERVHLQLVITHIEAAHAFNHEAGAFLGIEQVAPDPGELGKATKEMVHNSGLAGASGCANKEVPRGLRPGGEDRKSTRLNSSH